MATLVLAACMAFALALALAEWVRRNAVALGMVDAPNERSSHARPTPRGGGLGIVLGFLLLGTAAWAGFLDLPTGGGFGGLLVGALLLGVIGFIDDRGHVPASVRLAVHVSAAAVAVYSVGAAEFALPGLGVPPAPLRAVVWLLAIVWLINLYNFMDGTDGIAAVEAITVLIGLFAVIVLGGADVFLSVTWLSILAAGVAGFLLLNWSPARVFMGDAASGFLGFILAALVLDASRRFGVDPLTGLILLGTFVVDATWTLLRRLLRGQPVHQAHRSHAYQRGSRLWIARLVKAGASPERARALVHRRISLIVGGVNLFWLLPWALFAAHFGVQSLAWAWAALIAAYLPLVWVARRLRAGIIDD